MIELQETERCSVHYQPVAGGTTNTMCSRVVRTEPDGSTIFKTVSDSKRLKGSIRYEPNGESERISISDRLKDGKHVAPVKINGAIRWKDYYEIHLYTAGWRTSTKLGKVKLNIPGIEGMGNATSEGTKGTVRFENGENLEFSVWFDRQENTPHVVVKDHPMLKVEELKFDDLEWFHDAYPFSGTSLGVRLAFKKELVYDSLSFSDDWDESGSWHISREYGEDRTRNDSISYSF